MAKSRSTKGSFQDYRRHISELPAQNHSLICIYGSSEILAEKALDAIRIKAKSLDAEITTIEGSTLSEVSFEAMTTQTTLFDTTAVYVVRRAEQAKLLAKLLKSIPSNRNIDHRLVFNWTGGEPSAAVYGELKRLGAYLVPCLEPWPNEIPQVVKWFAAELGLNFDSDAINMMMEANGLDLIKHHHELTKISLIRSAQSPIQPFGKEDIAPLIGLLRQDDSFQLDRLLIQKNWAGAQALATSLLARGEKSLGLLAILANHCRNVIKINAALSRGVSSQALAQEVRLPSFVLKSYLPLVERVEIPRYVRALHLCHEADLYLKSTPIAESLLISKVLEVLATPSRH